MGQNVDPGDLGGIKPGFRPQVQRGADGGMCAAAALVGFDGDAVIFQLQRCGPIGKDAGRVIGARTIEDLEKPLGVLERGRVGGKALPRQ